MTTRWWMRSLVIEVSAVAIAILVLADITSPVRVALALFFMAFCPGLAWVQLLRITDRLTEILLSILLSFALDVGASTSLVYAGHASPNLALAILVLITMIGLGLYLMGITVPVAVSPSTRTVEE